MNEWKSEKQNSAACTESWVSTFFRNTSSSSSLVIEEKLVTKLARTALISPEAWDGESVLGEDLSEIYKDRKKR